MNILLLLLRGTIIKKLRSAKRTKNSINGTLRALGLKETGVPHIVSGNPRSTKRKTPELFESNNGHIETEEEFNEREKNSWPITDTTSRVTPGLLKKQ